MTFMRASAFPETPRRCKDPHCLPLPSGVKLLPNVAEAWNQVKGKTSDIDWFIAGYPSGSKSQVSVLCRGRGGLEACSTRLPQAQPCFGAVSIKGGTCMTFFYADNDTPTVTRGRAVMHKNGVLSMLHGNDGEFEMQRGLQEGDIIPNTALQISTTPKRVTIPAAMIVTPPSRRLLPPPPMIDITRECYSPSDSISSPASPTPSSNEPAPLEWLSIVPYELLRNARIVPEGVDPKLREESLSDDDFEKVLHMNRMEFRNLASWKKSILKRKAGLF